MPVSEIDQQAMLDYSLQLSSTMPDSSRGALGLLASEAIRVIGELSHVSHAHLLIIKSRNRSKPVATLCAEWSASGSLPVGAALQEVPIPFFGEIALKCLQQGNSFFTAFDERNNACSKLVSGLLRELNLTSYEMIPVISTGQLTAIIGLAHNGNSEFLCDQTRRLIQLTGGVLMQSVLFARRERKRRRSHIQWKRVANGACDFALRVNMQGEIIRALPFRQTNPPNVKGLLLSEFVSPGSADVIRDMIRDASETTEPRSLQIFGINSSGRPCSYAVRIEPPAHKSRSCLVTLYLTNNDLERAHEAELCDLRSQLSRAARLSILGNIATEFAHQLAQPLQAISNHVFTIISRVKKNESPESFLKCVEAVETSANHAGDIIRSLRDFLTNRRVPIAPVRLTKMITHAVAMVEVQMDRFGTIINVRDPEELLHPRHGQDVYVDEVQTTHVLINLLVNAMEACSDAETLNPEITITAKLDASRKNAIVEVSDNGPGIKLKNPDGVFDRFFTTKSEGFGIGLAICRDVIERQHGSIHADNNPDKGCRFWFTLPLGPTETKLDESSTSH
jgi:signal transduction histidine kinase